MNPTLAPVKNESFRDSIATINKQGKRNWIFSQQPKGRLYSIRSILSVFYLLAFFSIPFIRIHDEPFFLFTIVDRTFIFFGSVFWPQDFFILCIGMLCFILFVVLFTVIYGPVFCGWACPQTIFMEMVFRRIEFWIEGNANEQKRIGKLDLLDRERVMKRGGRTGDFF